MNHKMKSSSQIIDGLTYNKNAQSFLDSHFMDKLEDKTLTILEKLQTWNKRAKLADKSNTRVILKKKGFRVSQIEVKSKFWGLTNKINHTDSSVG